MYSQTAASHSSLAAVGSLSCNDTHDIRAFIAERIKDGFKFISDGLIGNKDV